MRVTRWLVVALLLVSGSTAATASPTASLPSPTLSLPPAGIHGHAMWDSWFDLAQFGYTQQEYFVSGTADDGTGKKAAYRTRFIMQRPISAARFNGTVLLDWTNVTAQFENAVDTLEAQPMLLREGFAFVRVSAQSAGLCCSPLTPEVFDPVRYGSLHHPGDAYALSMFSQIAKSIRSPKAGGLKPLGTLRAKTVIAVGQSQSADELYDYVTSSQVKTHVIDGFLIHGGGKKRFPGVLQAKVLHLLSDREAQRQGPSPDPSYRLWEVAGTAHSDYYIGWQSVFGMGPRLADLAQQNQLETSETLDNAANYGAILNPLLGTCVLAGSTMPMHYATSSAIYQLSRWASGGKAPVNSPRFGFGPHGGEAKDSHENSVGGIRLPPIQVPVASYLSTLCPLGGITVPFSDVQLHLLYPSFADYQAKMKAATDKDVSQGWLLPADGIDMMYQVCKAAVRWQSDFGQPCPTYRPPTYDLTPP